MAFQGHWFFYSSLALGGYVYYSVSTTRKAAAERQRKAIRRRGEDVSEITLECEGKRLPASAKAKRLGVTAPAGLGADAEAWEQLASSFVGIRR
jgi:hypothetical protein